MSEENTQPQSKHIVAHIADVVAVLVLGALLYFGKIDETMALTLIALIIGAKLPSRGAGLMTLAAPALGMLQGGPKL